jgi:hypothetical protein
MSFIVIISNLDEEDDESEDDDDDLEVEDEDLEVDDEPVDHDYIQKNWHKSLHDKDYYAKNWHRSLDDEDYFNANANRNNQCFRSNCFNCHHPMAGFCQPSVEKKKKKNDKQTKDFIYGMLFEDLSKLKCGCKEFQGKCLLDAGIGHVGLLRERFWGTKHAETVKTKDKGKKLEVLLRTYYDSPNDKFRYSIGEVKLCERAFFLCLGLIHKPSQQISRQIRRVMYTIRGKLPLKPQADEETRKLKTDRDPRTKRSRHAVRL